MNAESIDHDQTQHNAYVSGIGRLKGLYFTFSVKILSLLYPEFEIIHTVQASRFFALSNGKKIPLFS